jgi:hypothetical protein
LNSWTDPRRGPKTLIRVIVSILALFALAPKPYWAAGPGTTEHEELRSELGPMGWVLRCSTIQTPEVNDLMSKVSEKVG